MTITVLDTYPAIREVPRSPLADRAALPRAMLGPVAGRYRYFPDEVDIVAMHRMGSGFPLDDRGVHADRPLAIWAVGRRSTRSLSTPIPHPLTCAIRRRRDQRWYTT